VSPFHTCCRKKFLYSKHITGASNIETKLIFSPKLRFAPPLRSLIDASGSQKFTGALLGQAKNSVWLLRFYSETFRQLFVQHEKVDPPI